MKKVFHHHSTLFADVAIFSISSFVSRLSCYFLSFFHSIVVVVFFLHYPTHFARASLAKFSSRAILISFKVDSVFF